VLEVIHVLIEGDFLHGIKMKRKNKADVPGT
jgi:hypothetical protein